MTARPVVRYHGGKWLLAPWIVSHFPRHRTYVEPYGGGGSVLLRKERAHREVYKDLDGEIVNVFRMVRDRPDELLRALELTPFSRADFVESYETNDDPIEQARRTIYRSFAGFGSPAASGGKTGFRKNSSRSGTTPARDWRNYPDALVAAIDRMRGVVIENRDALDVMRSHDGETTLHYVDPPYTHGTRSPANPYCRKGYRHEMTDSDHQAMAYTLRHLRGFVIVSGYRSQLYDELFDGWRRIDRSAKADGARDRVESLWLSPNVPATTLF